MKSFVSFILGAAFVVMTILFIPVERLFNQITDTDEVVKTVTDGGSYDRLVDYVAVRMVSQEGVRELDNTPLQLTRPDLASILHKVFPQDWFINMIRSLHGRATERLNRDPSRSGFAIELGDRKDLLADEIFRRLQIRVDEMPECTSKGTAQLKLRSKSVRDLIGDCRPPEPGRSILLKRIRNSLAEVVSVVPDTFHIISPSAADESEILRTLRELRMVAFDTRMAEYLLLAFLLGLIALVNLQQPKIMVRRIGTPTLIGGILLSAMFGTLYWFLKTGALSRWISDSFANGAIENRELILLLADLSNSLSSNYCWNVLLVGILMLVTGVLLVVIAHFGMHDDRPV